MSWINTVLVGCCAFVWERVEPGRGVIFGEKIKCPNEFVVWAHRCRGIVNWIRGRSSHPPALTRPLNSSVFPKICVIFLCALDSVRVSCMRKDSACSRLQSLAEYSERTTKKKWKSKCAPLNGSTRFRKTTEANEREREREGNEKNEISQWNC